MLSGGRRHEHSGIYSSPQVDTMWLRVYYNKISIYLIFYLLKGDYIPARAHGLIIVSIDTGILLPSSFLMTRPFKYPRSLFTRVTADILSVMVVMTIIPIAMGSRFVGGIFIFASIRMILLSPNSWSYIGYGQQHKNHQIALASP